MNSYKEVFQALAEGKEIQVLIRSGEAYRWKALEATKVCHLLSTSKVEPFRFRIQPETVNIYGKEVSKPETESPHIGVRYYWPSLYRKDKYDEAVWYGHMVDKTNLQRGLVHLTKEAAIAHAEALISFTGKP